MKVAESSRLKTQVWLRASAAAGAVLWELTFFRVSSSLPETELINKILLFAVLVITPLGLLVAARHQTELDSLSFRFAAYAQPFGAVAVVTSFLIQQGTTAALLSGAWLVVTILISLHGLIRLRSADSRGIQEVSIGVGFLFITVGGGWLTMSRLGIQPLGFGDTIVLLTAVHFHYAGFAAPVLCGLAGRVIASQSVAIHRVYAAVVIGVIAGTPLVAIGITMSPALGFAGTVVISLALIALGALVLRWIVPSVNRRSAQLLLILSSLSPFVSMLLAAIYAYSIVAKQLIIDIPHMAQLHGTINAFGFSFCGLLAWYLLRSEQE